MNNNTIQKDILDLYCRFILVEKLPLCILIFQAKNERLIEAQDRAAYLDAENKDLVQRIIELKDSQVEQMNKMNDIAQEVVSLMLAYSGS